MTDRPEGTSVGVTAPGAGAEPAASCAGPDETMRLVAQTQTSALDLRDPRDVIQSSAVEGWKRGDLCNRTAGGLFAARNTRECVTAKADDRQLPVLEMPENLKENWRHCE
jgi:hypothetical protein